MPEGPLRIGSVEYKPSQSHKYVFYDSYNSSFLHITVVHIRAYVVIGYEPVSQGEEKTSISTFADTSIY